MGGFRGFRGRSAAWAKGSKEKPVLARGLAGDATVGGRKDDAEFAGKIEPTIDDNPVYNCGTPRTIKAESMR
jgi:hypothetical protein